MISKNIENWAHIQEVLHCTLWVVERSSHCQHHLISFKTHVTHLSRIEKEGMHIKPQANLCNSALKLSPNKHSGGGVQGTLLGCGILNYCPEA